MKLPFKKSNGYFWGISLFLLAFLLFLIDWQIYRKSNEPDFIYINETVIKAEKVTSSLAMYRGLSGRLSLCDNCGMLFEYPNRAERWFVMRKMNFPLDIIFVDEGKIVNIAENLLPEGRNPINYYSSGQPVNTVLEVPGGFTKKNGIKIGDQIASYE